MDPNLQLDGGKRLGFYGAFEKDGRESESKYFTLPSI